MAISLTKKAKCQGCKALISTGDSYFCTLGFSMDFKVVDGIAISPVPKEKCYKPRTKKELDKANEIKQ